MGAALFRYSNASGVLVSQAGVGATAPIRSGRIVVDEAGTRTAIALVNPSPQAATAPLILRDASGNEVKRIPKTLAARQHLAQYIREREFFPDIPVAFVGSLSFESDLPYTHRF